MNRNASDDRQLESAVLQMKDAKQHLLMLLASYNRASKALEKSVAALSEGRRLLLEAEKLLAEKETISRYRYRTTTLRIVAQGKKQGDLEQ
jgi:hypothetical protein